MRMAVQTKRLKTTNQTIAEKCDIDPRTGMVILLGCENLCFDIEKHFKYNPRFKCTCNNFSTEFGEDDFFYYELSHYDGSRVAYKELGLGNIELLGSTYVVKRTNVLAGITDDGNIPHPNPYIPPPIGENSYVHIEAFRTSNVSEVFIDPHVMAFSNDNSTVSPLYVEKNSIVGRLKDNIQSMHNNDIVSLISDFTKSITLKAYKLYAKILNCSSLVLSVNKQAKKPPRGTLIWSDKDRLLKFYDGKSWKTLVWTDDEVINENT